MASIERMASFYLGKQYQPEIKQVSADDLVMYDARDLTTHAVCVGMTGSGKTGLCTNLLEEAALDGIPSIVIDPKGDMTNLLLTFPDLAPADFEPWVNVDDARRKGLSVHEYASSIAQTWAKGLAEWGESGERIRKLKESAEFVIYTPGSDAGIPISVLHSLRVPKASWDEEEENLRELIASTVSALLGLVGIEADPVRSREHILLSHITEHAWRNGQDLDLALLIRAIQDPPLKKLGVFDVDTFYPEKERLQLAMALNSVVASPSFENWLEGPPLDVASLLRAPDGRPRVSVFYIAHLNDAERMFFVTLLLEQVLAWMRTLSGTTSLRCLVYFDEVFGYFPPYPANPPSKRALLALVKTARAFGIGLVLATQNPVDLDYKGLTNAGTWFIGKLQTDRDKARLLEGMEGVISESGTMPDRAYLDPLISSLDSRVFILHNVHADRPVLFKTRWALSYLRGPLARRQVRKLMKPMKRVELRSRATPQPPEEVPPAPQPRTEQVPAVLAGYESARPHIHARVAQYFLPVAISEHRANRGESAHIHEAHLVYEPYLVGLASAFYHDKQGMQSKEETIACLVPLPEAQGFVDWERDITDELRAEDLEASVPSSAFFGPLPEGMTNSPPYTQFRNDFIDYIYRERPLRVWVHPKLKLTSRLDESAREFKMRCREEARQRRDQDLDRLGQRYAHDLSGLQARLEREERELTEDRIEYDGRKREEMLSAGESIVGALLGRRRSRALSQASQKRRMTSRARAEVEESEETIEQLRERIDELSEERKDALAEIRSKWADVANDIQESALRPRKSDIRVKAFGLGWIPHWILTFEDERGYTDQRRVPAYPLP